MTENSKSDSSTDASTASTKDDITWQNFYVDIYPVNKEHVFVVTPQPIITTPKSNSADKKKEKVTKEDRNSKALETDTKRTKKKSNTFESIEKAYQVLPQAVNNLAVASTGPESVPLWGIMEHEDFASLDENEHESEDSEFLESPIVLYAGHSKVYSLSKLFYLPIFNLFLFYKVICFLMFDIFTCIFLILFIKQNETAFLNNKSLYC